MKDNYYYNKNDLTNKVCVSDVRRAAEDNQKIRLIRLYRALTGMGLKDSKNAIEQARCIPVGGVNKLNVDDVMDIFERASRPLTITKEEFLQIIEEAIDVQDKMFVTDMLETVATLCRNIRDYGGLSKIALDRQNFLDQI